MKSPFAARIKYSVPTFLPLEMKLADFEKNASVPFAVAVEGEGFRKVYDWKICGDDKNRNADIFFTDKILQFMLWAFGGKKVYLCGNNTARDIAEKYAPGHEHAFDASFMETIYRKKISFEFLPYNEKPDEFSSPSPVGGCTEGSRIGLDLGGTSIKSVLLLNGVTAISEIREWDPIANPDPSYHYARISSALKSIAEKAGKIDALGISTAGIVSDAEFFSLPSSARSPMICTTPMCGTFSAGSLTISVETSLFRSSTTATPPPCPDGKQTPDDLYWDFRSEHVWLQAIRIKTVKFQAT